MASRSVTLICEIERCRLASDPQTAKYAHNRSRNQESQPNEVYGSAQPSTLLGGLGKNTLVEFYELTARFGHRTGQTDRLFFLRALGS